MAVKTFTTGEVLTASDTNTYLANAGLVYITSTSFTSGSTVSINNCFSATYDAYRIVLYNLSQSGANATYLKLRASGTDSSASYDTAGRYVFYTGAGSTDIQGTGATTGWQIGAGGNTTKSGFSLDIFDPYNTRWTTMVNSAATYDTWFSIAGRHTANTSYDGFTLLAAGGTTFTTGTVIVYGYRKA